MNKIPQNKTAESERKLARRQAQLRDIETYNAPKKLFGGFWIRLAAFLVDRVMIQALTAILLNLTVYRIWSTSVSDSFGVTLIELVIFVGYFFLMTYWLDGQTPGKLLFRLRVMSLQDAELSKQTIFYRELLGKVLFFYHPWLAIILVFTFKRQHIIDILADTTVVNEGMIAAFDQYEGSLGKVETAHTVRTAQ